MVHIRTGGGWHTGKNFVKRYGVRSVGVHITSLIVDRLVHNQLVSASSRRCTGSLNHVILLLWVSGSRSLWFRVTKDQTNINN